MHEKRGKISMEKATVQGAKYVWLLPDEDKKKIADIAQSYNISFPIAHTLLTRGFADRAAIDAFLFSSHEKDVADPQCMKDAQKAVDRFRWLTNDWLIFVETRVQNDGNTSFLVELLDQVVIEWILAALERL